MSRCSISDRILAEALKTKNFIKDDPDTKFRDARSNQMIPGDIGDHLPVPDEAVTVATVGAVPKCIKGD